MMAALMDATAADMTAAEATATAVTMIAAAKDWLSLCNTGAQRARQCCLNTQGQAFGACGRRDYAFEWRCAHLCGGRAVSAVGVRLVRVATTRASKCERCTKPLRSRSACERTLHERRSIG